MRQRAQRLWPSAPTASAATRCGWARCRARATSRQALDIADVLAVAYFHAMRYRPEDPDWEGRDRFLLSNGHYAIALYAALIEAGIVPEEELETYGSDDSRLPMSGMAAYTPGMEMSGGSLGLGLAIAVGMAPGAEAQGLRSPRLHPVLRRRARRGLGLGGDHVGRALQARQPDRHRRRQQPAGRRPFDAGHGLRAAGRQAARRSAGSCSGWTATTSMPCVAAFDAARASRRAEAPHDRLPTRCMGKGVPFLEAAREEPLHPRRCARMAAGARRRSTPGGQHEQPAHQQPQSRHKPRLTTSAMIASIAAEGQRTKPAPFGHALVELAADAARDRRHDRRSRQVHRPAHLREGVSRPLLPDGHGRAAADAARPPAWRTRASCPSPRPMRCSPRAAPTTSSTRRSPRRTCNVKIVCALPGLTSGYGPSHQAAEDLALFRAMPNMTVIDPCDALEIEQAVPAIAAHQGPVYMRLLRGQVPLVLDEYDYQFELGKAKMLRDGADVLDHLLRHHDDARAGSRQGAGRPTRWMWRCCTSRRSSRWTGRRSCAKPRSTGRLVVVAENHTVIGGLGEAVAGAAAALRRARRSSGRSACPTSSCSPARCRPCTTATASRPRPCPATIKGWLG